jgi:hypothetical protein
MGMRRNLKNSCDIEEGHACPACGYWISPRLPDRCSECGVPLHIHVVLARPPGGVVARRRVGNWLIVCAASLFVLDSALSAWTHMTMLLLLYHGASVQDAIVWWAHLPWDMKLLAGRDILLTCCGVCVLVESLRRLSRYGWRVELPIWLEWGAVALLMVIAARLVMDSLLVLFL